MVYASDIEFQQQAFGVFGAIPLDGKMGYTCTTARPDVTNIRSWSCTCGTHLSIKGDSPEGFESLLLTEGACGEDRKVLGLGFDGCVAQDERQEVRGLTASPIEHQTKGAATRGVTRL